ncbi:non-ribosomal peptide synthetase [Pseudomonas sp. 91RF]|uniref:non-ribosomal peptide synthetase n=1 Tax=Pseudomonas sp. 91RF TaxID=2292261 RepID=UPI000E6700BA|nr:non-ribosomal peptide synthetase [Pseudomonas sp. 91RF]RIJ12891.1 non-ribosomal peptide synthetase [Pseudomonas sp. 91RF]
MNVIELLATLKAKDIQLAVTDDQLRVQGNKQALSDPAVLALLREHKPALIELIKAGQYSATKSGQVEVPANGIAPGTTRITPAMLTLADLDQATIDRLVDDVPGGAANVQDIYPLAPLQEGILYHHVSATQGDPYVMQAHFAFADRDRLNAFIQALQAVIDRHDILRTAVVWEGLDTPQQVVWREAGLPVEEIDAEGDALDYLHERFDAREFRMDVSRAPMMRLAHAWDEAGKRVVATLLFHHMALDHSALDVVRHEMRAFLTGQGNLLGRPVAFRDYVAQARLGVSESEHESFFRDMLGDIDEPTLPFGLQDVQGDGHGITELSVPVEPALGQRLRGQARQLGVSAASLFHLAWAQVLATLAGKQRVVFGTVLMGRLQGAEATDRALGIFINTLPVRVDVDAQSVRSAVQATHARLTTLMRHEHAPLALAQRCSSVAAPTPLFSALLNYRHSHGAASASAQTLSAWEGITTLHSEERTNYPLTLSIDDLGDAFSLTLLATTEVDPQRVCDYMLGALNGLVSALEQAPDSPVSQVPILPEVEREQILRGFNATLADYPQGLTIHQRFEAQVVERPEAVAAVFLGEQVTYAELNLHANALAHHLISLGVRPDDRVAIVARRGLDTLAGLLAILKAGAGYVPVDPAHPPERLSYLLSDSAPAVVLTQSDLRDRLPTLDVPVIDLDRRTWPLSLAHDPQVPGLTAGHLAYVIYTSGSTGLPKGVMVEHRTLSNLVDWHCGAFDLCAGRHTSSLAGFGFDAMAWEVWPALCAGATLHLAPTRDGNEDIDALLDWWRAQPLDVSFLPTPVAEYAFSQNLEHPTLRTLLIGGDRLRQFSRHRHFDVINNYGPTETTVVATSGKVEAGQALHIGRPVSNATVYLLDEQQRPVPIGVAGELYVGGAGVARGYLNRPDLTAERFLDDPFNGGRMYRTGDLARWQDDGTLEYLGRNDDQVKIRGVRIELGEIETRLNQLPGIQEAVLLAREDEPGQPRLVAYYTEQAQVEPQPVAELRACLLAQLPEYMVPTAFVRLDALPLTANGKVDRKALPAPDRAALFTRHYEAPHGELEIALARIWGDVLQVGQVGRWDHFFELGGHSLLAMRMVSQVRQRLGVELALSDLFANAELAAVAEVLAQAGRSSQPAMLPVPRDGALPLSFAQQRLWFLARMEGVNTAYNIPLGLRLRGHLDEAALQRSLARIIDRHETLRSRFVPHDDDVQVMIAPVDSGLLLRVEDLRQHPHADDALQALIREQASTPFDLQNDPLIRGCLVRLADDHHVLLLTLHHIISDGWSMGVLTRELMALYQAFSLGEADPLPPLALQYADYAIWQRRWLSGEVLQQQSDYWQQTLAGAPTLLVLPTDRPRPAQQDYTGSSVEFRLDEPLSAGLKALSQRHGVTMYMTMVSAWALLLSRLSGQSDVVIGSPVANRGRAEIEGLIGLFINTLALRIDTSGGLSVEALLARVKTLTLQAQAHQDLPFEQVVEVTRPARSLSHSPLFQTTLSWESSSGPALELGAMALENVAGTTRFAKFDLSLTLGETRDGIRGVLEYATALFDESTIQRYVGYFEQLLHAMVANDQAQLEQLDMVQAHEREQLLVAFNDTHAEFVSGLTIAQRFEAQVIERPEAVAAVCQGQALTFAELNRQANTLAHHLIGLGVRPDDRVAIVARRGLDTLVGLVAILKAGAGYVPVDPAHPAERLNYLLSDSAPVAVLCLSDLRERLPALDVPVIDLDLQAWPDTETGNPQVPDLTAEHLAYVIYTSGSTGLPKGVMVEHHTLSNLVDWHCKAFDLCAGRHTSSLAGFGFDAMAWEVWPALCAGATLHLAPARDGSEDVDALLDWWRAQPLDVSFLPTPVAEYAFSQNLEHPTLRTLLIGGDRLRQFNRQQSFDVVNNYGPTEATVVATSGIVEAGQALHIGKPIANATVYLLDEQQRPVPVGVAGELYVGGAGVARGYLNRPDLTEERFLRDPFNHGRMYRTGDLARWRADGSIEYLGRNDDQVKIRGVRVELGEIETRLNQLPGIQEAVLVAREDEPGQVRLVAYFTEQAQGEALAVSDLRAHLLGQLPEYMVPAAFVRLDALPLTANGKVDRKALPVPDRSALFTRDYQAPQGELEITLAQIWAEVLQVEQVGRQDHFFELGGHSLLAMRMLSQVRQRLGVELTLAELFANAELAAVAEVLAQAGRCTQPAIMPAPRDGTLPLSFAQQRLWFMAQLEGANTAYNIPLGLRLRGRLDETALQRALARILERHETLRSRFAQFNDEAQVLIAPLDSGVLLRVEDLRRHPQADDALLALIQGEASGPFDLQDDPLIRGRLVRLADDHHVLLLTLHHIVSDGWSMGVLTRELMALYQAFSHGEADPLPPLALQYSDYAVWQRRWLSGEVLQRQSDYWQQTLAGAPALLMLPTDRPRPALQDYAGSSVDIRLDEGLSAGLKALCQRHGVTPYMAVMSAWAMLLGRLSGQSDVVIGSPVANRNRAEIEGLIGLFVNTLAVRIDTSGALTVEALLARVKARTLEAQAHQDLPFEQVVEITRPVRSLSHSPLFQTLLSWDSGSGATLALGDLTLEGVAEPSHFAKFDLSLTLGEAQGVIRGSLEYATALFDESTVQRYAGYLQQLLQAMVSNDQALLEQVDVLAEDERRHLLHGFNATDVDYNLQQSIHGLFEAQVLRSPQAVAVLSGEQQLSYIELNARANRLAHHLRGLGVGPDARVAICVERGLEMVVGLLAILKAGGGYVPLDPAYPLERLAYMLEDSAPSAVLVQGSTRALLGEVAVPVVDLDHDTWQSLSADNPSVDGLTPQHTAYVIYTSGSTGQPKGVINEHSGVVNRLLWMQDAYRLTAEDSVLQKTPFSFDVSVWEFFWPLMTGARLVMARPGGHKDPLYLSDVIERERISTLHFVPSMLDVFLAHGDTARCHGLRQVMCSGEALPGSLVRRFKQQLPNSGLHNLYGPTEAAVDVTAWDCAGPVDTTPDNTPIGKPIANTRMYILDAQQQPVPQGVVGELYIGGVQVARGYLNRPELSAERFLNDPFQPNGRLYRTGDVARYLADGNIEYLGRNDDQVKIRGLRIELGEIQSRLTDIRGVQEAAVLAREDVPGDKRLVAYYTGLRLEIEVLRGHLLEHLPDYMVPAVFVHLDALPLSPNGKLDRKALPVPDQASVITREYEAPVGEVEILLAGLWAELLNAERVGRHDNFFELGGHSLMAVNLVARMRHVGLTADVRVLFSQPTLAALAAAVGDEVEIAIPANGIAPDCKHITPDMLPLVALDQPAIDRIVASIPGGAANVQDIYPLAPLQAGILFHHLSAPQGDPYVLQAQFAFADESRMRVFAEALQAVIERHDILRTSLFWDGLEEPVQVVWRQASLVCETVELDESETDALSQLRSRFDTRHYRMAVTQAPLMRVVHSWDAVNRRVVALLLFHHLVMDHIALEVLRHEMQSVLLGQVRQLAEPVPYRTYVARTRSGLSEEEHETFFRDMLGDIDEPTLPYGQGTVADGGNGHAQRLLNTALSQRVRAKARRLGISAASLMHLAWASVLGQLSGRENVVFGTVMLGRLHGGEGAERALGVFINTLPLRIDLDGQTVKEAVLATHQRLNRLLHHEHAPLALVQRCSAMAPGVPLFNALFNYRHSGGGGTPSDEVVAAWQGMQLLDAEEHSNYRLSLSVDDLGEDFSLTALTMAGIDAGRICDYMDLAVESLLQALERTPQLGIDQLSILPRDERRQLLVEFNATQRDYPATLTVHRLFELQVTKHPQAVAVVHGRAALTYEELNQRANRLAHYLIGQGVQPGDHVAILLPRSLDLLIAQLAIGKCAAAYVPLDINAPAERQAFLVEDCGAKALLTLSTESVGYSVRRIDLDALKVDAQPTHNPDLPQSSESVAYIMYTSGSTGTPKGVMVPHRAIGRLVINNGYADFNPQDRVAFASNPAFDASTMDVWGPLLNGGRVVVIDHATLLDPQAFGRELANTGATILFVTTALFNQYVQLIPEALKGLRMVLCGGERADPAAFRRLLAEAPDLRIVHCYGPTETTTYATTFEVREVADDADSVPIGGPISNTQVYVLDARQQPVPMGVTGELYIGGQGVALGYLNRPDLTAEKFLQDPFGDQPGALLYRTGDLARWLAPGQLECIGRNDDQVKIRGFRIELGEIENRLLNCEGVREAIVLARQDGQEPLRLVAYFTAEEGVDSASLRSQLHARLPEYMVPSAWVQLDALPLNNNGKVDRKALPIPAQDALLSRAYETPANPLEETLAQLWAEVLQVEQVGRHDNFFELGGHSLLAIRLVNLMQQNGLEVTLAELFQHASIESLGTLLSQRTGAEQQDDELVVVRSGGAGTPLFLIHEFSGMDAYFPALGLHIEGDFPIYGLPGIPFGQAPLRTMECLAARMVEIIRSVQPLGPYRLAGWSFGGVLAYEVAMQLLGMDETVAFVGLIDSFVPRLTDQGKARWSDEHAHKRQLLQHCTMYRASLGDAGQAALAHLALLQTELEQIDFQPLLQRCRDEQLLHPEMAAAAPQDLWHYLDREVAHGHALAHYRINPLGLPLYLFRAQEHPTELSRRHPTLGWSDEVPATLLHCIDVPGDHQSMMQAPHVQVLGQALGQAVQASAVIESRAYQPLLTIQTGHAGHAPIFCVPGAGDSVTGFIHLTEALGPEWPIYGLQPRGLDGATVPHSRVESAATFYLRALEQLYPQGPVHLIGHSFGGWVAYAMAAQLQAAGREVASLTLIDSESPGGNSVVGKPYTTTAALLRLIESLQLSSGKSLGIDALAFAEADDATQMHLLHDGMVHAGVLSERSSADAMQGPVRTFATALRTVYQPALAYTGPVRLALVDDPTLDATGNQREQAAMLEGWQREARDLAVWYGPGNHFTILKAPNVFSLAAWWHDGLTVAAGQVLS